MAKVISYKILATAPLRLFWERHHLLSAQMKWTYIGRTEYILLTSDVGPIYTFAHVITTRIQK